MIGDVKKIVENIEKACDNVGKIELVGVRLECADPKLLDVRDGDFDEHVSIQPAAIAYYGVLKKQAERQLEEAKCNYERWQKRKHHEAKIALETKGNKKITIADIEAFVIINWETDIKNIEKNIMELQEQSDTLDSWYDAWKQKSFSLKEHGTTLNTERLTSPYIEERATENIRNIQRKAKIIKENGPTV